MIKDYKHAKEEEEKVTVQISKSSLEDLKELTTIGLKEARREDREKFIEEVVPKLMKDNQEVKLYHGESGSIMSNQNPYNAGYNACIKQIKANQLNK